MERTVVGSLAELSATSIATLTNVLSDLAAMTPSPPFDHRTLLLAVAALLLGCERGEWHSKKDTTLTEKKFHAWST